MAPDTVDAAKLTQLREIGITRVNLGLQAADDALIRSIGRSHGYDLARSSIEHALTAGFANVCVDLIYGLPGQEFSHWRKSVYEVLRLHPQTICAYPLTLRPGTVFGRRQQSLPGNLQYEKYEFCRDLLLGRGYAQETHVRYIIPGQGGYQQKANHWAGQDVLGLGAGARGYLQSVDYRNGYSLRSRHSAWSQYMKNIDRGVAPYDSGIVLDADERKRRNLILGLLQLNRKKFETDHGTDPAKEFAPQLEHLSDLGLVQVTESEICLTPSGRKYRDVIVQSFFSEAVWQRIADFNYHE